MLAYSLLKSNIFTATELDLLAALSLHNTTRVGVSVAPGMQTQRTAYALQGKYLFFIIPHSIKNYILLFSFLFLNYTNRSPVKTHTIFYP